MVWVLVHRLLPDGVGYGCMPTVVISRPTGDLPANAIREYFSRTTISTSEEADDGLGGG